MNKFFSRNNETRMREVELDIDRDEDDEMVSFHAHPADSANWWSFSTFSWIGHLMKSAHTHKGVSSSDIPLLSELETCRKNTLEIERLCEQVFKNENGHFSQVVWRFVKRRIIYTSFVYFSCLVLGFFGAAIVMRKVLDYASNEDADLKQGIFWVILLIFCELFRVFLFTLTWAFSYRTAIRLKTGCMGIVYKKLFQLENLSSSNATKILNLISSDCNRIFDTIISAQMAIGGPLVLIMCAVYIIHELGFLALVGLAIFPCSYPIQFLMAKAIGSLRAKMIAIKDERISLISESISHQKFIKMFAWEEYFQDNILKTRAIEKGYLLKSQFLQSLTAIFPYTLLNIAAIVTFLLYLVTGHELRPAQAFVISTIYFARVRPILMATRNAFYAYFDALTAIKRIQCFTIIFLFSLFSYSTRTVTQIFSQFYEFQIFNNRIEEILKLPNIKKINNPENEYNFESENALELINTSVTRYQDSFPEDFKIKKAGKKKKTLFQRKNNKSVSIESLLNSNPQISFQLKDIGLIIKKGSLTGIGGVVGSGKSTFLESLASSLSINGIVNINGKVAYASQTPWIFKDSLRANILFGETFDAVRYYNTINQCCLVNDFATFPAGDLTLTDEKGSNLSGGQKLRISLARAVYHSPLKDIYLLDDPFSGLDTRTAKTIFEKVICQTLKNKTVLLATHHSKFLKSCDEILVFSEGRIVERGTHEELATAKDSYYANLHYSNSFKHDDSDIELEDTEILNCNFEIDKKSNKNEFKSNKNKIQNVSWRVYYLYIRSLGGWIPALLTLLMFALFTGVTSFSSWWLKDWFKKSTIVENGENYLDLNNNNNNETFSNSNEIDDNSNSTEITISHENHFTELINKNSPNFEYYRNVYAGLIGVILLLGVIRSAFYAFAIIKASQGLHLKLLVQFFQNRLHFNNKTGNGHILNLFSKDMEEIDSVLPRTMENFLQNLFIILSVVTMVSIIFPQILLPLGILLIIFIYFQKIFKSAINELKRFESEARTPIFTHVFETSSGLATIRAFCKERLSILRFEDLVDRYHSLFYARNAAIRWLSFRLDIIAVSVTSFTAIFILIFHGKVSAAACGLALSYAAQLSGIFQFTARLASETEANFISVERLRTFLKESQPEEEKEIVDEKLKNTKGSSKLLVRKAAEGLHPNWPYSGNLKFSSVFLNYNSEPDYVLYDVSFEALPGQKIGIIGRSGSSKSTISSALFRIEELKSGQIVLDDVDISKVSLSTLRNSLCIIPQDPILFQQNIRFNLDPSGEFTDEELWEVLEKTGLSSSVPSLLKRANLSQGQKQLLTIARALLRKSKVVFIDESTSSIDEESSFIIDRLLAEEFRNSTVFIVAHKMSALTYCDHLLIMDEGRVRDFGPINIVSNKPEFKLNFEKMEEVSL